MFLFYFSSSSSIKNILLDEEWNCKITDFGMARFVDPNPNTSETHNSNSTTNNNRSNQGIAGSPKTPNGDKNQSLPHPMERPYSFTNNSLAPRRMTICGTEEYMAPELLFDEEYSFNVDIFCFGMVLFEVR